MIFKTYPQIFSTNKFTFMIHYYYQKRNKTKLCITMEIIPSRSKEIKRLRNKEIKALYKIGYTYEEISQKLNVSRTTIFFALNNGHRKKSIIKNKGSK